MGALIAFIALGIIVATLIEINERIKAKKKKDDCPQKDNRVEACADCSLQETCTKEKKSTAAQ